MANMRKALVRIRKAFGFASDANTLWGWLSALLPKGIWVLGAGALAVVIGAFQGMTPAGALLLAVIAMAGTAVLLHYSFLVAGVIKEKLKGRERPAIEIEPNFYVDCDHIKYPDGEDADRAYSVALSLWVINGQNSGAVLRNLRARAYLFTGEHVVLPIRGAEAGITDLRDGEHALIEVGRVLWRLSEGDNSIPAIPRAVRHHQVVEREEVRCNSSPKAQHRSIKLSNALEEPHASIGEIENHKSTLWITVVISADDVKSRMLKLQTNLFAEKARDWLIILPDDWKPDESPNK